MKLARFEQGWGEAAIGAIFPGLPEEGLADIASMDLGPFLREVMRDLPLQAALGVRVAIWLVAWAPLFVLGRFAVITGLARAERESLLAAMSASRRYAVRSLVLVLKTVGAFLYARNAGVRARMRGIRGVRSPVTLRPKALPIA
jgi:hypothetical protein